MASAVVCDSRLIDAIKSVDSWDNEEPLVVVTGSIQELRENALIVKGDLLPTARSLAMCMQMSARFQYRFGESL